MSKIRWSTKLPGDIVPSRGFVRGKYSARKKPPRVLVVHSTGSGVLRHFPPRHQGTARGVAERVYGKRMDAGPHYVVGQGGDLAKVCPEFLSAWHVGSKGSRAYKRKHPRLPDWWKVQFPELTSPFQLGDGVPWEGGSVNENSIGVEVIPDRAGPTVGWTQACRATLWALIADLNTFYGGVQVWTHSELHPNSRTDRFGRPYDTFRSAYDANATRESLRAGI